MNNNPNNCYSEIAMSRNANSMRGRTDNYLKWNLSVFPIEKNKSILDLGCGLGAYFNEIIKYTPSLYTACDYSSSYIEQIKVLFNGYVNCNAFQLDLADSAIIKTLNGYRYDYIFLFDVLEHIKDEKQALKNIYNIMKTCKASRFFLRVPALQFIYGENDRVIGHYRRYSLQYLKELLESCSFYVDKIRYQNFAGIIPWFVIGNILKRSLAVSMAEGRIFNSMVPMLKAIEEILSPPIGLSLYCSCSIKNKYQDEDV